MRRHVLLAGLVLLGASGCVSVTGPKAIRPGAAGIALGFETVDTLNPLLEWQPTPVDEAPHPAAPATGQSPPGTASGEPPPEAPAGEPAGERPVIYDVAIHEVIPASWSTPRQPGARVYYREGIAQTSHRVEASLEPGREYFWFVRTRRGDRVGPWSRYRYFLFFVVGWASASNQPYRFRTPSAPATPAGEGASAATEASGAGSGPQPP